MSPARASLEVQLIIAIGALFAVLMISAFVRYWYDTSDGSMRKPDH